LAAGSGLSRLRKAGIQVELGLLSREAASLYKTYTPKGSG
jgi:pyrimidine deaminase RibD-like protein